ncbi:hypothetical protein RI129_000145 [Pyrocoelia pectoralis]|uniref:DDE Tnp4 domain-containing protein n=1 Tax=Pyrocoelia pectoralis TaxID=417401 RepID=A0AAN7ZBR9_9COLE
MSLNMKDLCLISTAIACVVNEESVIRTKKCKKRKWVKTWLRKRNKYTHVKLLKELEPDDYRNYMRMPEEVYMELLDLVSPYIEKNDTVMRQSISPHERLSSTLRCLATGRSLQDLKYSAVISPQALGKIIPETCKAICTVLWKEFAKFPTTKNEWEKIANGFEEKWNFPNCLGAVDGKHIIIVRPPNSGSYYYNYKGFFSIVLMAIVNANYEFILVDVGTNGRVSDGGVLENTDFFKKLVDKSLNIPDSKEIGPKKSKLPFVFVGDEAFSLRENFMKPYNVKELDYSKKIFNYRLSRARNVVEIVFGILAARFRLLHTQININETTVELAVLACCILHNYLRRKCGESYTISSSTQENVNNTDGVNCTANF